MSKEAPIEAFIKRLDETGWTSRNHDRLVSPSFRSLKEMQQQGEDFINIILPTMSGLGADQRGQTWAHRLFHFGLAAEMIHAAADSELTIKGGQFEIYGPEENSGGTTFHFGYHPIGSRCAREVAIISCAPGTQNMSSDDWETLDSCLQEMGLLVEIQSETVKKIFEEAAERVSKNLPELYLKISKIPEF